MYLNRRKLSEIIQADDIKPLDDAAEIEDLLVSINSIDTKLDFLKQLKKARTKKISTEIDKNENYKEKLKATIIATLEMINSKSLSFPGVGSVVRKDSKGKWVIEDETELLQFLDDRLSDEDYDEIVQTKPSINKSKLNKLLDNLEKSGDLPSAVSKTESKASLTVKFDESITDYEISNEEDSTTRGDIDESQGAKLEEYDQLEI